MGEGCEAAKAAQREAAAGVTAAEQAIGPLEAQASALAGELATAQRRFDDGASSSVALDAAVRPASEALSAARAARQEANATLARETEALRKAEHPQSVYEDTYVDVKPRYDNAVADAERAEQAVKAAEAELAAAEERAAKGTAYVTTLAAEREAVMTRQTTNANRIAVAQDALASARSALAAADAAVARECG